jgi:hypothetical protein
VPSKMKRTKLLSNTEQGLRFALENLKIFIQSKYFRYFYSSNSASFGSFLQSKLLFGTESCWHKFLIFTKVYKFYRIDR